MKRINGFSGLYSITKQGAVYNLVRRDFLTAYLDSGGVMTVSLRKEGKATTRGVHTLMAGTYIPNPEMLKRVRHIDGDKMNNNLSNLEWCRTVKTRR